jgi:hypothetical protein
MNAYEGVDVWTQIFSNSALVWREWSASRPCRFTPGKSHDTHRYLLFKWQSWYSLFIIIHLRKFFIQHHCTLQLVWWHGVSLVCTVYSVLYSEIALSRKLFGIRHMYMYTFCLQWPILWPPRTLTFPPGTPCIDHNHILPQLSQSSYIHVPMAVNTRQIKPNEWL